MQEVGVLWSRLGARDKATEIFEDTRRRLRKGHLNFCQPRRLLTHQVSYHRVLVG